VTAAAIRIEIVYAEPQRGIVKVYRLEAGSRVADVLKLAAADPAFTGVDVMNSPAGIFGQLVRPDAALLDGDRIEIYRPLAADPKLARRERARRR
jgi:putative ubiquitin-RnfH superfamily antitoxin RatB of RatAB toxin-antitoxin module